MHPAGPSPAPVVMPGALPPGPPPRFPAPPPPEPPRWPRTLLAVATVVVGLAIAVGTVALQGFVWLAGQVDGVGTAPLTLVLTGWVNAALIAGPSALLWFLAGRLTPVSVGVRAAGRAWTLAGIAGGVIGTARAVAMPHNEILLLITAVLAAGAALGVHFVPGRPASAPPRNLTGFGVAAGLAVVLPWLLLGALGGATETVAALMAAAAAGWLAAEILNRGFFSAYLRSRPWMVFVGGLAAGVALVPIGMSVGGAGLNLAAIVILPALGFAVAALAAAAGPGSPGFWGVAALYGLGAFGPLAFVDPEEAFLIVGFEDVGLWALIAGIVSVLLAYVVGGVYGLALSPRRILDRWIPLTVSVLLAVVAAAAYGLGGHPGLYGDQLFVVMADQPDLTGLAQIPNREERLTATYMRLVEHANRSQASIRSDLDGMGLAYTPYYLVNGLVVDAGPIVRAWLSGRSDVDRVLIDQRLRPLPAPAATVTGNSPPPAKTQPGITMLHADRVWTELDRKGGTIVIGSSDSGVDGRHPALKDGFRGGDDSWYDPWNNTATPTDHGGHGTHTLGSAVGDLGIGVAPDAQWVGCVNLDRNYGSPSRYLDCLQFMLAPFPLGGNAFRDGRPARAPHVLTNSWGCPTIEGCDLEALRPATAALKAAGVFVVAAAGNSGPACGTIVDPPAPYSDVFTVGAVDGAGAVAGFSSRGPVPGTLGGGVAKPDVVAPGVDVLSALPGGTYGALSGTSMATPHVAGVVALMWQANPALIGNIDTTAKILRDTAVPARATFRSHDPADACRVVANVTGAGIVDAYAAVKAAIAAR